MSKQRLYLDHAATTPVLPQARAAMADALERWANPSSPHTEGRAARAALESSRERIAQALGWRHDVILTSGASEAITIAAQRATVAGRAIGATEHEAVPAAMGRARVLPVDADGIIDLGALEDALAGDAALLAIQHVNNETGVIQPIAEIAERVHAAGSLLLVDCAQSAGKLPPPEADFIAVSGHKFGGPPGAGALLVRDIAALRASGGQERGYRRGTENLPAAAAMAAALETKAFAQSMARFQSLRSMLDHAIQSSGGIPIASNSPRSPAIGAYALPGVTSASQLVQLDLAGIAVSAGSACASGSMKPSRVLEAMHVDPDVAASTIRVSFGPDTGEGDVERLLGEWRRMASRARSRAA
jgi:cysteine desulfurase